MAWIPETPFLTADIIIELLDHPNRPIVLIERKNPPPGWALPGGFVDRGERVEVAAVREALEETGLKVKLKTLLGVYSDPNRDPRMHTTTPVYIAEAHGDPVAADDAKNVMIVDPKKIPVTLAFDHGLILADYVRYRESGQVAPLREA
ncbi:MAG: NUDIX hydrolase [Magnetococcales bacterium]|nr:NUDIX hydrolase [Magnetococcales bacterium]